jgi:hypothetical protein
MSGEVGGFGDHDLELGHGGSPSGVIASAEAGLSVCQAMFGESLRESPKERASGRFHCLQTFFFEAVCCHRCCGFHQGQDSIRLRL